MVGKVKSLSSYETCFSHKTSKQSAIFNTHLNIALVIAIICMVIRVIIDICFIIPREEGYGCYANDIEV